jgi:segregation and condensation protein B
MLEQQLFIAALFFSGKPVGVDLAKDLLGGTHADLRFRLEEYASWFNSLGTGLKVLPVADGFQLSVEPSLAERVGKYFGGKPEQLSRSALETASIIAYKQPVTKAEIEQIRGHDSSASIRSLLEKKLIAISGRKNVAGRPLLYSTTKYFLEYFGMNNLKELPTYKEWLVLQQGAEDSVKEYGNE